MEADLIEEDVGMDFDDFDEIWFDEDDDDDFEDDDDDIEDDDDALLAFEDDDDDVERRRRRRRRRRRGRRPKTARGRGYFQRQLKGYVKRTELRAALAKVGRDVRRNGTAIKRNAGRISSNASRISAVARSNSQQTKDIAKLRADMQQAQMMSLLMNVIQGEERTYKVVGADTTAKTITLDEQGDTMIKLLPLLMTSSAGGGSGGFDMSNPLMILVLADAFK